MRMQVILDSVFAAQVQPLYGAGRKESSGTGLHIGSNGYMDTGVRDLAVAFFKADSTWFNDICSKDLIGLYMLCETHITYMPVVKNQARIASNNWKS